MHDPMLAAAIRQFHGEYRHYSSPARSSALVLLQQRIEALGAEVNVAISMAQAIESSAKRNVGISR